MAEAEEKPKSRIEALEEIVSAQAEKLEALEEKLGKVEKTAVKKSTGLFGGKRERKAIKDTKTGKVYVSKAAVGKALATEAGTVVEDHFAWYKLQAKFPERFIEATPEEKATVEKEEEARMAELVRKANEELAKEEAAKVAAEAAAKVKTKR